MFTPTAQAVNALSPNAVLRSPVVIESRASIPIPRLLVAGVTISVPLNDPPAIILEPLLISPKPVVIEPVSNAPMFTR